MGRLFGTDGVRGVANSELTPELVFRLGEAAGHFLADKGRGRLVVGRDSRLSGDMLEAALVAGICSGGADAFVCGVVPTPAVAYLTKAMDADGGVVISASHNPPEYNGVKFFSRDGFKLTDELEDEIEEYVKGGGGWSRPTGSAIGVVRRVDDANARYISHAVDTIEVDLEGMTIAVDCGHGAASVTTITALKELGAKVIPLNCDFDGAKINVKCGSTDLSQLRELVLSHDVDFGVAHDGDADRVLVLDEKGETIDGDTIIAICAAHLHSRGDLPNATVVGTVMSNLGFDVAMKHSGIQVIRTKVGDRYVLEQMQASGAVLGGEQSGHIIFMQHNTTGDGLIAALQLASVIKQSRQPLSSLAAIMTRYPQVLKNVRVKDKALMSTSVALSDAIAVATREMGEEGRVLVRASGTEPLVRVMVEAADEDVALRTADHLARIVKNELG
ncbi:MAG: phosphoglucosamine mutase [Actinobacteria bacterium]|nr:phosphoglucosamine mutase [Actinomycetota bacterium]